MIFVAIMLHSISILEEDESKVGMSMDMDTTAVYVMSDTLERVQWSSPHHLLKLEGASKEQP